ncbi:AarF/UbiB family protein, partial [Acinetobacter baumannii]
YGTPRARELAHLLIDAYVHQFFGAGVFHGDPHPGNLFDLPDGRLCFHDFGTIGYLDAESRLAFAQLIESIAYDDAA